MKTVLSLPADLVRQVESLAGEDSGMIEQRSSGEKGFRFPFSLRNIVAVR